MTIVTQTALHLGNIKSRKGIDAWICCRGDLLVSSRENGLMMDFLGKLPHVFGLIHMQVGMMNLVSSCY